MAFKDPERKKQYNTTYQRQWKRKNKAAVFAGQRCSWCNSDENLRLHHLDPQQKEDHRIWSWSKARRQAEIAKCIILCHACHCSAHAMLRARTAEPAEVVQQRAEAMLAGLDESFGPPWRPRI